MIFFKQTETEENRSSHYNGSFLYKYIIEVKENHYDVLESMYWSNMPFNLYYKYMWYFDYRAALLKVKYPKLNIKITAGVQKELGSEISEYHFNRNKIIAAKRKVTEFTNKLKVFSESYNKLFPIEEDELYITLNTRLKDKKNRLVELEKRQEELNQEN